MHHRLFLKAFLMNLISLKYSPKLLTKFYFVHMILAIFYVCPIVRRLYTRWNTFKLEKLIFDKKFMSWGKRPLNEICCQCDP